MPKAAFPITMTKGNALGSITDRGRGETRWWPPTWTSGITRGSAQTLLSEGVSRFRRPKAGWETETGNARSLAVDPSTRLYTLPSITVFMLTSACRDSASC
jgi:hypothetical protein